MRYFSLAVFRVCVCWGGRKKRRRVNATSPPILYVFMSASEARLMHSQSHDGWWAYLARGTLRICDGYDWTLCLGLGPRQSSLEKPNSFIRRPTISQTHRHDNTYTHPRHTRHRHEIPHSVPLSSRLVATDQPAELVSPSSSLSSASLPSYI